MQNSVFYLGCSPLIEELAAYIPASSAGHVQLTLVTIATLGAFPNELAIIFDNLDFTVITAHLAIIALGV